MKIKDMVTADLVLALREWPSWPWVSTEPESITVLMRKAANSLEAVEHRAERERRHRQWALERARRYLMGCRLLDYTDMPRAPALAVKSWMNQWAKENDRAEALEADRAREYAAHTVAVERCVALEAECRRLREAIERHRDRTYGLSLTATAGIDFDLYSALAPQAGPPEAQGRGNDRGQAPEHLAVNDLALLERRAPEAQGREEAGRG